MFWGLSGRLRGRLWGRLWGRLRGRLWGRLRGTTASCRHGCYQQIADLEAANQRLTDEGLMRKQQAEYLQDKLESCHQELGTVQVQLVSSAEWKAKPVLYSNHSGSRCCPWQPRGLVSCFRPCCIQVSVPIRLHAALILSLLFPQSGSVLAHVLHRGWELPIVESPAPVNYNGTMQLLCVT